MTSTVCDQKIVAYLELKQDGHSFRREIRAGERLFVGADETSDVCLSQDGVAATHCAFVAQTDTLTIEDCYSPTGTFVNSERIRKLVLTKNSEIQVGPVRFFVTLTCPAPNPVPDVTGRAASRTDTGPARTAVVPTGKPADLTSGAKPAVIPNPVVPGSPLPGSQTDELARAGKLIADLRFQLLESHEEIRVLQSRLQSIARPAPTVAFEESAEFQAEMIEMLRAEVVDLQAALAEREALALPPSSLCDDHAEDRLSREESERLVERLEHLLAELASRDDEIQRLSGLVSAAEETGRAEREERAQIDQWIREIEQRFSVREQDWKAEKLELQKSLEAAVAERNRAETMNQANAASGRLEAAQNLVQGLRETAEAQRGKLLEAEQTINSLKSQLEQAQTIQAREEQVRLAQERAEIARLRQELEAARSQAAKPSQDEAALKLRALRQHLNELHSEQVAQREERRLSSRLANLWGLLDRRS